MLPQELLDSISIQYPCRVAPLQQLSILIGTEAFPSPQAFTVHGLTATGKSAVLRCLFDRLEASSFWVPCHECITTRQLLERIAAIATSQLGEADGGYPRCENISALTVYLQQLLKDNDQKHFLVLDRIDQQRDAPATLLASLRRLGELIPKLTIIFVMSVPQPRLLSSAELPHVHFPPYTKEESIEILSINPLRIPREPQSSGDGEEEADEEYTEEDAKQEFWVWQKFCSTVWDSLARGAARNIIQFRDVVERNWIPFVQPIARGEYGMKNYSNLYILNKDMFQRENTVIDSVIPLTSERIIPSKTHDLPYYTKFLLCASYLASYNPPRFDALFFMKASDGKKKRRGGRGGKRQAKTRKIARRLLGPQAFSIERLLAIFHSVVPQDVSSSVDILAQIATLTSMRLLVKASTLDPLDGSAKWKVNVGWDYVRGIARGIKFDIEDHIAE